MRLKSIFIENYRHIKNFRMLFKTYEKFLGDASIKFFIGRNGSGKSALLEAIGLIFTRVLQDESPGFNFAIRYSLNIKGEEQDVLVTNRGRKRFNEGTRFNVFVKKNGKAQILELSQRPFSSYTDYHPKRIIAYSTGPNSYMQDVIVHTPRASLISDIYDLSGEVASFRDISIRQKETAVCTNSLKNLTSNPKCLFIDGETAKIVLVTLLATVPAIYDTKKLTPSQKKYCNMRNKLIETVTNNLNPIAFSLVADNEKIENTDHHSFKELFFSEHLAKQEPLIECLNDWQVVKKRAYQNNQKVAVFNFAHEYEDGYSFFHSPKVNQKWTPIEFLTILLTAKYNGVLKDVHIAFKNGTCDSVLSQSALSDGEYLWLARMGLILLAQDEDYKNSLFLFDEPDIHLNETWIVDFISLIHEFSTVPESDMENEFIISTHSSLMLTDADPDQMYHFINADGKVAIKKDNISTFGANTGEISKKIFGTRTSVGRFSNDFIEDKINKALESKIEELEDVILKTGPGYLRFRLLEKYLKLNKENISEEGRNTDAD